MITFFFCLLLGGKGRTVYSDTGIGHESLAGIVGFFYGGRFVYGLVMHGSLQSCTIFLKILFRHDPKIPARQIPAPARQIPAPARQIPALEFLNLRQNH